MSSISPATSLCTRCRVNPTIAIGLCRACGLCEAALDRRRRSRVERREQARERRVRRLAAPTGWPVEPEEIA